MIPENPLVKEQVKRQMFLIGLMFSNLWVRSSQNLSLSAQVFIISQLSFVESHDRLYKVFLTLMAHSFNSWRRQWHPTPILLSWKSQGQKSLVGYSPWGLEESDRTERLHFHFSLSCIGEGNGNPLQCSCLENPRDGGAWWAAVYRVAQSQTQLKRLSSSSLQQLFIHCLTLDRHHAICLFYFFPLQIKGKS